MEGGGVIIFPVAPASREYNLSSRMFIFSFWGEDTLLQITLNWRCNKCSHNKHAYLFFLNDCAGPLYACCTSSTTSFCLEMHFAHTNVLVRAPLCEEERINFDSWSLISVQVVPHSAGVSAGMLAAGWFSPEDCRLISHRIVHQNSIRCAGWPVASLTLCVF